MKYLKNIFFTRLVEGRRRDKKGVGGREKSTKFLGNPKCQESLFGHQIHAIIINILFAPIRANIFN